VAADRLGFGEEPIRGQRRRGKWGRCV